MKISNLFFALLAAMLLVACGFAGGTPVATATQVDVNALQTVVVQTIIANITQTAAAQPILILTETSTPIPVKPTETATPTPAVSSTAQLCDNSAFVSDASVPDGTQMAAGQDFVKTWKVKNTGTCSWNTGYQLIHAYGETMGGLPTALSAEVLPGSEVEISVNLKAPVKPGNYSSYWRLASNNGVPFGMIVTVMISVP